MRKSWIILGIFMVSFLMLFPNEPSSSGISPECFRGDASWATSFGTPLQTKDSKKIQVKFAGLKYAREKGKDSIQVYLTSNLPEATILNCRVDTLIFSLDQGAKHRTALVRDYLIEVGKAGRAQDKIKNFSWDLPPAIYIIKVKLADKQRREVRTRLPRAMFGKALIQKALVIGSVKDLIKIHRNHLAELHRSFSFYEAALKDVTQLIELYNEDKEKFREQLKRKAKDYERQYYTMEERINKILGKTTLFMLENYPGLYRSSYERVYSVGSAVLSQAHHQIIAGMKGIKKSKYGEYSSPDQEPSVPKHIGDLINKGKEELLKEALFDLLLILNHCAKDMELAYDKINRVAERKKLSRRNVGTEWAKEKTRFQDGLNRFDKYFKDFRKEINPDEFKTPRENISAYQALLTKLLETYSSLVRGEEKEPLESALKETLKAMEKLFQSPIERAPTSPPAQEDNEEERPDQDKPK